MLWLVREGEGELGERLWRGLEESRELKVKVKEMRKYVGAGAGAAGGSAAERMAGRVRIYKQGNAEATRKVTAPIVRTIVEGSNENGAAGRKL